MRLDALVLMSRISTILATLSVSSFACGDSPGVGVDSSVDADTCGAELAALEQQLAAALDSAAVNPAVTADPNLTLLLEAEDGRQFTHSHGTSSPTASYESASTSKLVTAVVILDLVEQGVLTLDSKPSDLISFWSGESAITLRHLLSFRSGFNDEPACINLPNANFESCVQTLYNNNVGNGNVPGAQFVYSSSHMQIAGLMAMKATGKTWTEIFGAWKAKTGLFPTGVFDLPSSTNPRLAGGMHWTGEEYLALLRALSKGTVLTPSLRTELFANQRGSATVATPDSPSLQVVNEDWAYGLGNWLECPTANGANTFACGVGHRNSSPGAYGAYPVIDFDHRYVGILARQGPLGTFREGLAIVRAVQEPITAWADFQCNQ